MDASALVEGISTLGKSLARFHCAYASLPTAWLQVIRIHNGFTLSSFPACSCQPHAAAGEHVHKRLAVGLCVCIEYTCVHNDRIFVIILLAQEDTAHIGVSQLYPLGSIHVSTQPSMYSSFPSLCSQWTMMIYSSACIRFLERDSAW